ncbi:MAG: alpha/beta hydrolase, partial [Bacteroidetes bacterium]
MKNIVTFLSILIFLLTACQKEDFTRSGMADDHFFLQSDGQNMPVTVAGNLDSGKLLLIVHGGPGGNALAYRNKYVKANVEPEFAVVYWYQRYAGNSQGNGGDAHISVYRNDLRKLIQLLKNIYGDD